MTPRETNYHHYSMSELFSREPESLVSPYVIEGNVQLEDTAADILMHQPYVVVTGSLRISNSLLSHLPATLEVAGNLIIDNCPMLCDLPVSLRLRGQFFLTKVRASLYAQAINLEIQQAVRRVILI